jgi:hypothetical protein
MTGEFRAGDRVAWNSEARHFRGRVVKVHAKSSNYRSNAHRMIKDDPQHEIKSDKSGYIAMHARESKTRAEGKPMTAVARLFRLLNVVSRDS